MMNLTIQHIRAEQTLSIRHQVLWPDQPMEYCMVEGDDKAHHWGAFKQEQLVSVGSIYIEGQIARLRKFATLTEFQGMGIGSEMMHTMLNDIQQRGIHYFWLDARESAIPFYQRFGLICEGERFYKADIGYFKMSKQLISK